MSRTVKPKKRKLTPKQRVLRKYPKASCRQALFFQWNVWSYPCRPTVLGRGADAKQAWADAARRLK